MSLSWSAPHARVCDSSGISSYIVIYRKKGDTNSAVMNTFSTGTTITLLGLESATVYEVQIVAINKIGSGSSSGTTDVTSGAGRKSILIKIVWHKM